MIIGGGGTSAPSNQLPLDPPKIHVRIWDYCAVANRRANRV